MIGHTMENLRTAIKSAKTWLADNLDTEKRFYTYALMDSSKPGPISYNVYGRKLTFPYLPFYIGKGTGKRMFFHLVHKNKPYDSNVHKFNTIRKLDSLGIPVIPLMVSGLEDEATAYAKEMLLIETIGRKNLGTGPLVNKTSGGDGNPRQLRSKKTRRKQSASITSWWDSLDPEERADMGDRISTGIKARDPERKLETRARRQAAHRRYEESLTTKQLKERSDAARKTSLRQFAKETQSQRTARAAKISSSWQEKSEKELADIYGRIGESVRAYHTRKSPYERQVESEHKSAAQRALHADPIRSEQKLLKQKEARDAIPLSRKKLIAKTIGMKVSKAISQRSHERTAEIVAKSNATKRLKPTVVCPFCLKEARASSNMTRYHFDNCADNPDQPTKAKKDRLNMSKTATRQHREARKLRR